LYLFVETVTEIVVSSTREKIVIDDYYYYHYDDDAVYENRIASAFNYTNGKPRAKGEKCCSRVFTGPKSSDDSRWSVVKMATDAVLRPSSARTYGR